MGSLRVWLVIAAVVGLWTPAPVAAQQTVNDASVSGRVVDASGGAIPGARVTARQVDTNLTTVSVTDQDGRFRFPSLRVGSYTLAVAVAGFSPVTRHIVLTAGAAFDLPVTLSIAPIDTVITIVDEPPVVETARSQIAATVSRTEVKNLPLNGRNFLDVALVAPGVSPTNVGGGTQLFPETSAVPGVGLSVGSQRNLSNNFIVDGLSANDDAASLSGMPYGVDAVEEIQVVTSGGQAELGRALGGYVNVVTRAGTNAFHGDIYDYVKDDGLTAANPLIGQTLPMSQEQYGGSLGGPLVPGRTFFFVNAEQRRLTQSGLVTISDDNVAAINARLAAVGYPGPPVSTGVYPNPVRTTNALAKVDHQIGRNRLSLRYSAYDATAGNSRGAGALSAPSASAGLDNLDQTLAFSNVVALTPQTLMETRAQFASSDLHAPPSDPIGPAVTIQGVATFGTLSSSPTARNDKMYEVVNSVTHLAHAHVIKVGADFLYNDLSITFPRSARGSYTFPSLGAFLVGAYSNGGFTQTFGPSSVTQTNPNLGLFVQDEWKVGSRLTVNVGLRYDLQFLQAVVTDTNNLSPRLGMAWSPSRSSRTVIRGSAGLFFDRVPLRAVANALLSAGNTTDLNRLTQTNVSLSPTQANAPVFPNILAAPVPLVTLVNFTTIDPHLQNAYSRQASVEIERQLGARASLSVGVQHLRGEHLLMSINQNVPSCVASGSNNGCRPNPVYANDNQYSSAGSSSYNALVLSFVQRPARWGSYRVSYTLSKAMNNVGEAFFNGPIDPFDLSKDWGRSDDDERHRLVVTATIGTSSAPATSTWQRISHGFQATAMVQAYSALPFNITTGTNTIQGTAARPIVDGQFIARNAGIGVDFSSVNARLSRTFPLADRVRLDALIEGFNLLNRTNGLSVNGRFGVGAYPTSPASDFGQLLAVSDPRTFQIGLRLTF